MTEVKEEFKQLTNKLDGFNAGLEGEIEIPVISELFDHFVGEPLSPISAASFGLAVPVTVASKLGSNEAPFQGIESLAAQNSLARDAAYAAAILDAVSGVLAGVTTVRGALGQKESGSKYACILPLMKGFSGPVVMGHVKYTGGDILDSKYVWLGDLVTIRSALQIVFVMRKCPVLAAAIADAYFQGWCKLTLVLTSKEGEIHDTIKTSLLWESAGALLELLAILGKAGTPGKVVAGIGALGAGACYGGGVENYLNEAIERS